jgi:hypothetical protein
MTMNGTDEGFELHRIADILEMATQRPRSAQPPASLMSGRWHRRDGNVYSRVAERGSPNAGNLEKDTGTKRV